MAKRHTYGTCNHTHCLTCGECSDCQDVGHYEDEDGNAYHYCVDRRACHARVKARAKATPSGG
jgi:hypothetical protein